MERIFPTLKKIKNLGKFISLDTRKSSILKRVSKNKINLLNDVSGLEHDNDIIEVFKRYKYSIL